jgi:methylmalonyl-CoA/ethylmalonyl-CoA epimerase
MIQKAAHVCIMVRNLDAALPSYERLFGGKAERMLFPTGVETGFLTLPGGLQIEFFQPAGPETEAAKWLAANGEGIHHLCLEVDNVDAELARAASEGAHLVTPASRKAGPFTIGYVRIGGAGGALIEFLSK